MLLSKRRLVFTPYQMYFQCLNTHCAESVVPYSNSFDPSASVIPDEPFLESIFSQRHLRLFPKHGFGIQAMDIYSRLGEFTERKLSYSSDTLVAFYGIFNAYRRLRAEPKFLTHFWGIPVIGSSRKDSIIQISEAATFSQGLLWSSQYRYPHRLKRQGQWPSWSWTSDGNPVIYRPEHNCYSFSLQETIHVSLNLLNGSKMNIEDFAARDYDSSDFHSYIDITTWTLRGQVVADRVVFPDKVVGTILTHQGWADYKDNITTDIMVVYLGLSNSYLQFLMIEEAEIGIWKRIRIWSLWIGLTFWATNELGSLLRDPDSKLGHGWEYKTVRIA
jgi:hypothetical protein